MNSLNIYCLSIYPVQFNLFKKLKYIPVGLGKNNFSDGWLKDNTGNNISKNSILSAYSDNIHSLKSEIINQVESLKSSKNTKLKKLQFSILLKAFPRLYHAVKEYGFSSMKSE